jgi:hypothetical protein
LASRAEGRGAVVQATGESETAVDSQVCVWSGGTNTNATTHDGERWVDVSSLQGRRRRMLTSLSTAVSLSLVVSTTALPPSAPLVNSSVLLAVLLSGSMARPLVSPATSFLTPATSPTSPHSPMFWLSAPPPTSRPPLAWRCTTVMLKSWPVIHSW